MPSPTWAEYLAEAADHLGASRRAVELGIPPPPPPPRPEGPVPEGARPEVRWLEIGYRQLASEVAARLARLAPRVGAMTRPRPAPPPARYVDTPA
jgi:hypothetical protein